MALPLLIEAELDDRSAAAAMNRAERMVSDSARDMARTFNDQVGGAIRGAGDELDQMADKARTAFRRMGDSAEETARQERELEQIRDRSGKGVDDQADKVRRARREEAAAVREAASAYDDYEQAASGAGDTAEGVANSTRSSLAGLGSSLRGAGGEAAGGFAEGFGASGALGRLGAAGGPIGLALAAAAALGYKAGEMLMDQIDQGMASLRIQDTFQARVGLDPETAGRWGHSAGEAYANQFGASIEDNLAAAQAGIQARLIAPGAPDSQMQNYIQQSQALSAQTGEDPNDLARGARNLVSAGLVESYQQAFDLLSAAQQRGLDMSHDLIDTTEEYSTKFRDLGLSGSDALGLINQMLEGGARNTDQAADAIKEFQINASDGSKSTLAAFAALGFSTDEMSRKFTEGGPAARQAFGEVLEALNGVNDPMERQQIGLALFKTKWEDVGKAIGDANLKTAATSLGDVDGALKNASDTMNKHVDQWASLGRNIETAMNNLRQGLADSQVGKFLTGGLPTGINDALGFGNDLNAQAQAARDAALANVQPAGGFDSAGDAQRARRGLPPLPGAPGTGRITPVPMPMPGAPGASTKPSFDPSQYSVDAIPVQGNIPISPMAPGAPGSRLVVDPGKVFDAETSEQSARASVESARVRVLELEADNTATAQQIAAAKTAVQTSERAYLSAEAKLQEAQRGTYEKMQGTAKTFSDGMNDIGAHLDSDLGISKGLPGIADNLVKFLASVATAPLMGQLSAISAANPNQGSGLVGILASQGAFGPQYTPTAIAAASASGSPGYGAASGVPTGGYSGDAALLANVPRGSYDNGPGDLTKGLADCSSAVEDLVNLMDGRPTAGRNMATGNEAEWLTAHGFQQGMGGPGDFRVGFNSGHTQATLPGGTPFNWGSDAAAARGGVGGTGADDPAFTSHYYRPAGALPAPVLTGAGGPAVTYSPGAASPAPAPAAGFGSGLPLPLPVTIVGGGTGDPFAAPGVSVGAGGGGVPGAPVGTPASGTDLGTSPGPLPSIPAGAGGGQGYMGLGGPPAGAPGKTGINTGVSFPGSPGGGSGGIGLGGNAMDALMGAASMADLVMPGAGAAAQIGIKAINRTIQYAGQAAGIGASGLMETFLPAGSDRAAHGWLPRIVGGLAGAKPALPNMAGGQSPQQQPGGGAGGQGGAVDQSTNITNNVATPQGSTPDQQAKALEFHQQASNKGPGN